jgi:hypothetical protein
MKAHWRTWLVTLAFGSTLYGPGLASNCTSQAKSRKSAKLSPSHPFDVATDIQDRTDLNLVAVTKHISDLLKSRLTPRSEFSFIQNRAVRLLLASTSDSINGSDKLIVDGMLTLEDKEKHFDEFEIADCLRLGLVVTIYNENRETILSRGAAEVRLAEPVEGRLNSQQTLAISRCTDRMLARFRDADIAVGMTVISGWGAGSIGVLMNKGIRDGVEEGQDCLFLRDDKQIGRSKITSVWLTDSEVTFSHTGVGYVPVQPNDIALIYLPPARQQTAVRKHR